MTRKDCTRSKVLFEEFGVLLLDEADCLGGGDAVKVH